MQGLRRMMRLLRVIEENQRLLGDSSRAINLGLEVLAHDLGDSLVRLEQLSMRLALLNPDRSIRIKNQDLANELE
jgi:hypothetical protein